ncbi:MvdC family ATP-grasp ribosomal peptide maturase [Microcoleus sp. FACHB-672]|uniref:MvdC family ATP-grasp ribosomal peptide maturase n=1 Tax=Microcoleus sp. FACHB-672 TaxID=2692825 RepID=UPI001684207D|nr:MvdC family ATP-grasp ribosomal peptide maturase [Microcoleus sp. FACHB-672]MBD2043787.1 MvdC family ATP-grasp ribosomal peptide maturase [Microcoleus sp. FACHB-672]
MSLSRNIVLLLTHSGDFFTIDRVAEAIAQRGAQPFRLDTDQFPMDLQLSAQISSEGLHHRLHYQDKSISTEQVRSVWMRRLWEPKLSPELSPQYQYACRRESRAALLGFLDSLSEVRWVDDLRRISAAENKLRQLRIARNAGLHIPRTLVTNDPQEARDFFQQLKGKMVAKLLTPLSASMEGSAFFLYTSEVKEADLADAESLRYSPMVFQEQIPKLRELRVIFVAGKLFAGALDASRYSATTMDWRSAKPGECVWEPAEIPIQIADCLNTFMAEFGLLFGAFDFIQTPDNEYIFLEVNATGEWGMLERDLNLPISEAIADTLLG